LLVILCLISCVPVQVGAGEVLLEMLSLDLSVIGEGRPESGVEAARIDGFARCLIHQGGSVGVRSPLQDFPTEHMISLGT
jgi:hypothetical protein